MSILNSWEDLKFHINFKNELTPKKNNIDVTERTSKVAEVVKAVFIVHASLLLFPVGAYVFRALVDRLTLLEVKDYKMEEGNYSGTIKTSSKGNSLYEGKLEKSDFVLEGKWGAKTLEKGTITSKRGQIATGTFDERNLLIGEGKLKSNQLVYRGHFLNGTLNGQGTCEYKEKLLYQGSWKDGKPHGMGYEQYPSDYSYEGEFVEGQKTGCHGTVRVAFRGCEIEGQWQDEENFIKLPVINRAAFTVQLKPVVKYY